MKILIIIPAYNEAENIERVVNNLIENYPQYDYIVVNDGSKDNTLEICKANGYHILDLPTNLGLAGAFQTGIKYAYRHGYDAAVQLDGDGQHDPKYIKTMCQVMNEQEADIVIGSRFLKERKRGGLRMVGSTMIRLAVRLTTGKNLTDPTSGMRMFNKSVLKEFASNINYGPEPDTIAYLMRNGLHVVEVPVEMSERIAGQSYLNMTKALQYMIRMCVSILFIQLFRKRA